MKQFVTGILTVLIAVSTLMAGMDLEEAYAWQEGLRRDLARLMKITDLTERQERCGFDADILQEKTEEGYVEREIELQSTPGRRMRVILTLPRPAAAGRLPAVVCLHGHGGSRKAVYEAEGPYQGFAAELARWSLSSKISISGDETW